MACTPDPKDFDNFKDWLMETVEGRCINQASLAKLAGVSPQAVSLWKTGGKVEPETLKLIAQWAGVEYASLSMLLDGKPQPGSQRGLTKVVRPRDPKVLQLASVLELPAGDDTRLELARGVIQTLVDDSIDEQHSGPRT